MFALINLSYLAAAVCFILGIKGMTRPKTAVRGNQLAAIGMLIAVVAALLHQEIISYAAIIAGMLLGGAIGVWLAKRTATTEMPELVASLNRIGGGAPRAVAPRPPGHAGFSPRCCRGRAGGGAPGPPPPGPPPSPFTPTNAAAAPPTTEAGAAPSRTHPP